MTSTSAGIRAGIAAFAIWGALTVYWKQLDRFGAVELIGWRIAMMTVFMVILSTVTRGWQPVLAALANPRRAAAVALASILLTVNWTTYVYAVVNDQIVETALGYFLAPLGTMAIGVVILRERLTPLRWLAAGFALIAVAVLTISYGQIPWLAIIIGLTFAFYGLVKRNSPLTAIEGLNAEGLVLFIPALIIIFVSGFSPTSIVSSASGIDWLLVLGTGVATAVPLLLFSAAAQVVPFTILGPLNYLVPIINFTLGWVVYSEPMPTSRLIGFVLVWFALIAVTLDTLRRATVETPMPARLKVDG